MILVDQLAQSYRWSKDEIFALTMPQLIMLNHASWVSSKRSAPTDDPSKSTAPSDPTVVVNGQSKPFSSLTEDELDAYYGKW
jgi:hypothetical protein